MKANVLYGVGDLRYVDFPNPQMPEGYVLLKVMACGICGSDINRVFKTGTYHFPTIIGHEFSGEVVEVNSGDENWLHKRCAVYPLIPCMECDNCRAGNYETCINYNYLGSRCDGGFAEYVAVPKWNLLVLPDNVSFKSAAMFEPAAVALHALKRVNLQPDQTIAIVGPGTIGNILAMLANVKHAKQIIMLGRHDAKLDFAKSINEDIHTVNTQTSDWCSTVMALTGGKGVDIAVEGTGASASLEICLEITKAGGRILAMGNPLGDMNLSKHSYWKLLRKQLTVVGTWNSSFGDLKNDWREICALVSEKDLNLEDLITQTYPLSQLCEGLEVMRNHEVFTNKVMILNS